MNDLAAPLLDSVRAVTSFGVQIDDFDALSDSQVIDLQRAIAECDRRLDVYKTQAAKQLARRSRRDLGHSGLAARNGFASPEAMMQSIARVTGREASRLISIARVADEVTASQQLIDDGMSDVGGRTVVVPWEACITSAVESGELSIDCADAIRRGLGAPNAQVSTDTLRGLAERVVNEYPGLAADKLFKIARAERDLVDLPGVQVRQQELYDQGGLRLFPRPNGMWKLSADLDPEAAAELSSALDPLTSPRRGGPRFTDAAARERAQRIIDDPRSTERIALDGLLELVRLGVNADPGKLYGSVRPMVKIIVPRDDIESGTGIAVIENDGSTVAVQTAQRTLCHGDTIELATSRDGRPLDLGRLQ